MKIYITTLYTATAAKNLAPLIQKYNINKKRGEDAIDVNWDNANSPYQLIIENNSISQKKELIDHISPIWLREKLII